MPRQKKQVMTETTKNNTTNIETTNIDKQLVEAKVNFLNLTNEIAKLNSKVSGLEKQRDDVISQMVKLMEQIEEPLANNPKTVAKKNLKPQPKQTTTVAHITEDKTNDNIEVFEQTKTKKQVTKKTPVNKTPVNKKPAKKAQTKKEPVKQQPVKKEADKKLKSETNTIDVESEDEFTSESSASDSDSDSDESELDSISSSSSNNSSSESESENED